MPQTDRSRQTRTARATPAASRRSPKWLWPVLIIAVVLLGVVAIVVSRGSDDNPTSGDAANLEQTRPVTVTGTPLPQMPDSGTDPAVGLVAPDVSGASFDGSPVKIANDGRPKLVVFAAHWCPHCQREIPLLVQHLKDQPLPSGIDLYLVATGTDANAPNYPPSAWLSKLGWPSPVLADDANGTAAQAFGLPAYPFFVSIDSQGQVVARTSGEISMSQFDQLAAQAVAGQ